MWRALKREWLFLALLTALVWWLMTGDVPAISLLRSIVGRGKRLTTTSLDDDGNIAESPEWLARAASQVVGRDVSVEAYTLARIADSEHPTGTLREKAAIMRVMMNDAEKHGWSIPYVATVGKGYGRQAGRRCSTAQDPYEQTLALAESVLDGSVADETRGSTHFVHITGFANFAAYRRVVEEWQSSMHIVPVKLPGITAFRIFLPEDSYTPGEELPTMEGADAIG